MATLQNIRNRAGILVAIVIGLALVAFILGDALQQGNTLFQKSQNKIAEINGESIQYLDFQKKVEELGEIYKQNSRQSQLDENTWVQARETTWQNYLKEILMGEVYEELGINVSSEELYDLIQGNNIHPIVRQIFGDPNTGQVNRAAIVGFLKNLETGVAADQRAYWYYLEKQIEDDRAITKYNNLVRQGLYVTTEEAQNSINKSSRQVSFDFISLPHTSVADSTLKISDRDLKKYYNDHSEAYKEEKTRKIEYVVFPVVPSQQDDQAAKAWIEEIKNDFTVTEENVQFTNANSDENFEDIWVKEDALNSEVATWIYSEGANVNDVYGPYFEDGAYKLAKVHAIEMLPDSVQARHILLEIKTQAEIATKQALADSLKTLIDNGADFAALAREYSSDTGSAIEGGDLGWFTRAQMAKPFADAAFENKKGETSVVISQYGIHVVQPTERSPLTKQVKVAYLVRVVNASDVTFQKAYANASQFASESRNLAKFEEAVKAQNLSKRVATLREQDREVIGLVNPRQLVRAAFRADVGDVLTDFRESSIFELGDNYVIAALVEAKEDGVAPFESVKSRVELAVAKEKKSEQLIQKMESVLSGNDDFAVIAQELGASIQTAENINFNSFSVPNAGAEPALVGTISTMSADQISKPVKGNNGVYLVKVTAVIENAEMNVEQEKKNLAQTLGYRASYSAYEAVKNAAEIEDNRSRFY